MNIYHYDRVTGVFICESVADESPLENGVFLIPANATDVKPPKGKDGKNIVFVDGAWSLVDVPAVVETEPEPVDLAAEIRGRRNGLLSQSDWTQLPDSPVDSASWAVYRQELRDITSQNGFPDSVEWPAEPA